MDTHGLGQRPIYDSQNRRWYFVERLDGSICIYYTKPNNACHFIVWDSRDATLQPKLQLPVVMSPDELQIFNRQAAEDV